MADESTQLYRYTSNKDPFDSTEVIVVNDGGKELHRGGDPVELTEEEARNARKRFNLSKVSDEQAERQHEARAGRRSAAQEAADSQPADETAGGVVSLSDAGGNPTRPDGSHKS